MKTYRRSSSVRTFSYLVLPAAVFLMLVPSSKQEAAPPRVTITEFSDFQCPYCKQAATAVEQVRKAYGEKVEFVFKQMPLPMHQHALRAAQASVCAQRQSKFWEYHDRLFAVSDLSDESLNRIAWEVGLNNTDFNQCLQSQASRAVVEKDMAEAQRLGVNGTPTFFVEGTAVRGVVTFATLKQKIDGEMIRLNNLTAGSIIPVEDPLFAKSSEAEVSVASRLRNGADSKGRVIATPFTDPPLKAQQEASAASTQSGATLSISDITLAEDNCQNKSFLFTVTLSKLVGRTVTVHYATSDGRPDQATAAALANQDYVPVSGTLTFTHSLRPNGPNGSYLLPISVALGNHVASRGTNDQRAFTLTLSAPANATIAKAQGIGTLLDAATSCRPNANASCFVNYCGAAKSCTEVNASATGAPYCQLAGLGITPQPDPDFNNCNAAGLWLDTDGDGLSDAAEAQGYIDVNADGAYDVGIDVPLPGADPNRVDVYLHYDYLVASDHDHNPPPQAMQYIVDAFANHGANLHIDPHHNAIDESTARVVTQDFLTSGAPDYLPIPTCSGPTAKSMHQLRKAYLGNLGIAYHYMVFSHWSSCDSAQDCIRCRPDPECGNGAPPFFGSLGSAEINGDDAIVSLGLFADAGVPLTLATWAGVTMHELGHNFGLLHGGDTCDNYKPNYLSVMNYSFDTTGIPVGAAPGDSAPEPCATDADCPAQTHCSGPNGLTPNTCFRIDYSSVKLPDLNEFSPSPGVGGLDESKGLNSSPTSTDISVFTTTGLNTIYVPTNGAPIDWNQDGSIELHVTQDINNDFGAMTLLTGSNDWATSNGRFTNLNFGFQCTNSFMNDLTFASNRGVPLPRLLATGVSARIAGSEKILGLLPQVAHGCGTAQISDLK